MFWLEEDTIEDPHKDSPQQFESIVETPLLLSEIEEDGKL